MFGLGLQEILIILAIFFFLFGAKRLPQIGEGSGKDGQGIEEDSG